MSLFRSLRWLIAAVGLMASTAFASPIQLTYLNNLSNPTGYVTGTGHIRAGEFHFAVDGETPYWDDRLDAFCIEIDAILQSSSSYTVHEGLGLIDAGRRNGVERLFSNYYGLSRQSNQNSAAFQLALWEIINETGTELGLADGAFRVTSGFATAMATANAWLSNLGSATSAFQYFVLTSAGSQDLITVRPVPEPGTLVLMGAGLAGLVLLRRRQRS